MTDITKESTPDWSLCPITFQVMYDPVLVDGTCLHTCSRQAARAWLDDKKKTVCPVCSTPLRSKHLAPNAELRRAIEHHFPNMATTTAAPQVANTAPKTTKSNDVVQPHEPANNATIEIPDGNCSFSAALDLNVPPSSCYLRYKWRIVCVTSLLIMAGAVVAVLFSVAPTPAATELISNSSPVPTSPPTPITPTPSNSAGLTAAATEPPFNSLAVPTTSSPTPPPTPMTPEQIFDVLTQVSSADDLNDPSSPQHQAAKWAVDDKSINPLGNNPTLVQRYVLAVLYYSTNGNSWNDQYDFLNHNTSECQWNDYLGIECTDGSVSTIWLDDNNLAGRIPSELGSLSNLYELDLQDNGLTGTIPSSLGSLSNLHYLFLRDNGLTGTIFSSLGSLSKLRRLFLDHNSLTGTVPSSLGSLSGLEYLDLQVNSLTGTIPSSLGSLSNLEDLSLDRNRFTGTIPSSFGSLSNLEYLSLYGNELSGIPEFLCSLPAATDKFLWFSVRVDKEKVYCSCCSKPP